MAETETYHIKIDGQGVAIERDVPKELGDRIIVLLMTGRPAGATNAGVQRKSAGAGSPETDSTGTSPEFIEAPEVSLREYIDKHNAKRNPDMITAIGYYMLSFLDKRTFNSSDLISAFGVAAEPVPGNMPRDLKWAVRVGWIAQQPGRKGDYYVTKTGKDAVDASFPPTVIKRSKVPAPKRKVAKA